MFTENAFIRRRQQHVHRNHNYGKILTKAKEEKKKKEEEHAVEQAAKEASQENREEDENNIKGKEAMNDQEHNIKHKEEKAYTSKHTNTMVKETLQIDDVHQEESHEEQAPKDKTNETDEREKLANYQLRNQTMKQDKDQNLETKYHYTKASSEEMNNKDCQKQRSSSNQPDCASGSSRVPTGIRELSGINLIVDLGFVEHVEETPDTHPETNNVEEQSVVQSKMQEHFRTAHRQKKHPSRT
ncbi:uncharacterized protein LOC132628816 [Lycium barbarum]|uniref:uncharacterized protein LOC132628816 n=1 Tax=Lycium barbarum TaxID=112863 RepID=UPI00293E61E7|nr:uncharacterized protein LOC132628816 [Lycium barbarum]